MKELLFLTPTNIPILICYLNWPSPIFAAAHRAAFDFEFNNFPILSNLPGFRRHYQKVEAGSLQSINQHVLAETDDEMSWSGQLTSVPGYKSRYRL